MPILTIIDEQRCALDKVEALAQLGLAEPEHAQLVLASVLQAVTEARNTVRGVLGG